jgi:hypothetical protein
VEVVRQLKVGIIATSDSDQRQQSEETKGKLPVTWKSARERYDFHRRSLNTRAAGLQHVFLPEKSDKRLNANVSTA